MDEGLRMKDEGLRGCEKRGARIVARLAVALILAQVLLVIVSWMINATMPQTMVRSLLSSEGIRWFFGQFSHVLSTPLLVWLLLGSIAYGLLRASHFLPLTSHPSPLTSYSRKLALIAVGVELVVFIIAIVLLAFMPHAILLSSSGALYPSSFSASLVPFIACAVSVMSITYGAIVGTLPTLDSVFRSACKGIESAAPLFLLYVFVVQFFASLLYVI